MEGDSYMTDNKEQNFQWLRDITKKIKALNEGSLFSENILKIIINIALKYKENETHLWQEQIPYKIFKKLVSILLEKSENLVSEDFYRELKSLPYNHIIIQPFVEQQEISLLNYYDKILEEEPDNLEILLKRAVAYYNDNVLEYSLIDLEKILEINPCEKRAIKYKIKAQVKLEKYVEAYQELNLLLNINPDNEFALFERALLYLKFNYRDLAYTDIQKLEKSKEIEYLLLVCSLYYENNCIENTINICLRILEEVPDETEALMSLGKAYFKKQEYEKAIVTFDFVLKITAPTAYLAKYHYQRLSAMKYISDAKCQMNYYAEGIQGYLEIMALGGSNYFLKREYVKITETLINKDKKELDRRYLMLILNNKDNFDVIQEYADILCSSNDLRGNLIKYQNNLYASALNPNKSSEEKEMIEKVKYLWVEPNMEAEFEKGFPFKVRITNTQDIPYIERLPWIYTVRRLEIIELPYDNKEAISILFEQNLPALRELKVQAEHFGYYCIKKLIKAPFYENLESLTLWKCDLDAPSLKLIVENLPLRIKELRLPYGNAEDKLPVSYGVGHFFASSNRLNELKVLDLSNCSLKRKNVEPILSCVMPSLKSLDLSENDLSELDAYEFINSPLISNLEELYIGDTGIEKQVLLSILERNAQLNLKKIGAIGDWTESEIISIKRHHNFNQIEEIDLGEFKDEEESWMQIFNESS